MSDDINTSYTITLVPESSSSTGGSGTNDPGTDPNYDSDVYLRMEQIDLNGEDNYKACIGDCQAILAAATGTISTTPGVQVNAYSSCIDECQELCGDTQKIEIKITKNPSDLQYSLIVTYGTLGQKRVETDNYAESFDVNLESELEISSQLENVSVEWEGNVYDQTGNVIAQPDITFNEKVEADPDDEDDEGTAQGVYWDDEPVVGTIRVTGIETYDIWTLDIPPREDSLTESAFSSTVRAFYVNGSTPQVATLNISEKSISSDCGNLDLGSNVVINPDDEDDEKCYKRTITVDPCTGEILSDTSSEIACPDTDEEST